MDHPVVDPKATGLQIYRLREAKGLSVNDICDAVGVSVPAVYHWQNGIRLPSIDNLVVLASIFGVTIDEIVVTK